MSDRMIEIGGQKFSESTIKEALKKHCGFEEKKKMPVVTSATYIDPGDRVLIRLSEEMAQRVVEGFRVITIKQDGSIGDCSKDKFHTPYAYTNLQPVFGEISE